MAAAQTYEPIANYTASAVTTYTFSSIPSTYTDLIIIAVAKNSNTGSTANNWRIRFNGDTGSSYSDTFLYGLSGSALSARDTNQSELYWGAVNNTELQQSANIAHIIHYSNTSTYKTVLSRGSSSEIIVSAGVGLWRNTSAINSIQIYAGGSTTFTGTLSLYGIKAA